MVCSMDVIYVGWGIFHVTLKGKNGVVLSPTAVENLHVRQVLPYSMKFLIKVELKLSCIDDAVDQPGSSHARTPHGRSRDRFEVP
ncbi:hypothetical protein PIB30_074020 [Stylosanthes scabra]|uniref:Uncharacterized protein n=1 Tax=Stylosanthes scabra TaxID=79078 RepID=A0ABU6WSK7_9FABA|nr:hypothetical protein [Stylosanthes scabra]